MVALHNTKRAIVAECPQVGRMLLSRSCRGPYAREPRKMEDSGRWFSHWAAFGIVRV